MNKLALTGCIALSVMLTAQLSALAGGLDPEIEVGDARAFVVEILGEPDGRMGGGSYEKLFFERGAVELEDGKVVAADLVSESEAAKRKAARLMKEQERQRAAAAARETRIKEGQAVLKQKLADKQFAAAPASQQVAYWKSFQKKYPEVNVSRHLAAAQAKVKTVKKSGAAGTQELTDEQQAELDRRIAEGINQPPVATSSRKLRRFRRGRSESATQARIQQITDAYMAELAAQGK